MATPVADYTDVQDVISTDLGQTEIDPKLDDAAFDIDRAVEEDLDTEHQTKLEAHLAALYIRLSTDRSIDSGKGASTQVDFDGSEVGWLRDQVQSLDPSGELGGGNVRRQGARSTHVANRGE